MITVVTGAGISDPSGIPTYRSAGSRWDNKRLEEISHYTRYGNHLDELWKFWKPLYEQCVNSAPNDAHLALNKLECAVLTQNIDSLHQRSAVRPVELHGSIFECVCLRCKKISYTYEVLWEGGRKCAHCNSERVRPAVTLFGEPLKRQAKEALKTAERSDLLVVIGTSGNVWPVAGLPELVKANGGRTVLINKEDWGNFDEVILGDVTETVPQFIERIKDEQSHV